MKNNQRLAILGLVCFMFICKLQAQNFNYTLTRDSSVYAPLSSPTVLAADSNWFGKHFGLKLPFTFDICGINTDSLTVEFNGLIKFGTTDIAIAAFTSFRCSPDSLGTIHGAISKQLTGTTGNRILKIQFSDLSENTFNSFDFLNYQIWLYESGSKIECHIGNSFSYANDVLLGIIDNSLSGSNRAFLCEGSPSSPTSAVVGTTSELVSMTGVPPGNNVYLLVPAF